MSAGPAGTPLAKKLGLEPQGRLLLRGRPAGFELPDLPAGCTSGALRAGARAGAREDVVIAFFTARAQLAAAASQLAEAIHPDGALWIAWPRRAAGHDSDIRDGDVREIALPLGLVDVKVAALGEDWSGLRLVWRRENRRA